VDSSDPRPVVPPLRLDDLHSDLQARLQAVLDTRDRVYALLEAVVTVSTNLDLERVLTQIMARSA
jgi:two-component system, NarL family, sensor histidine kinase DevS